MHVEKHNKVRLVAPSTNGWMWHVHVDIPWTSPVCAVHFGRPERLSTAQRQELVQLHKDGAIASGFPTELWTLPRIA